VLKVACRSFLYHSLGHCERHDGREEKGEKSFFASRRGERKITKQKQFSKKKKNKAWAEEERKEKSLDSSEPNLLVFLRVLGVKYGEQNMIHNKH
jgi:hypothetical protein